MLIVDRNAHGVIRSRLLTTMLGRPPRVRLRKDTAARLRLLGGGAAARQLDAQRGPG